MTTKNNRGIIQLTLPVVISIIGGISLVFGGFYASLSGASNERGDIKTEVAVERTRVNNIEKKLDDIDKGINEIKSILMK